MANAPSVGQRRSRTGDGADGGDRAHVIPEQPLADVARPIRGSVGRLGVHVREALIEAIKVLPEREQYVMSMYYEHDMNLREIAAVLKVTESRVCQLHSQSIARLRVKLREY